MSTLDDIYEELDWLTDRLSTEVRTVALGVLALAWGLLMSDKNPDQAVVLNRKWHLLFIGGSCVLVMFLDYLQYLAGYWNAREVQKSYEKDPPAQAKYTDKKVSFFFRRFFFVTKQIVLAAAVIWLTAVLGQWLWEYR
jgi:hypothetical protein